MHFALECGQETQNTHFELDNTLISPFIVCELLEELESQGLLIKEKNQFVVNIAHILSPENIINFCQYRIDEITLDDVLISFGFKSKISKTYSFNNETIVIESKAYQHCQRLLEGFVRDGVLLSSEKELTFFWNFKR